MTRLLHRIWNNWRISCRNIWRIGRHNRRRKHKDLHTELGECERPAVVICRSEHHEAAAVSQFLRGHHQTAQRPWREMAVLYRVNALSRVLEDALRNAEIPYVIARGTADPPQRKARMSGNSISGWSSRYCWMPSHTVGTPAENVTFSSTNSFTSPSGERSGPG